MRVIVRPGSIGLDSSADAATNWSSVEACEAKESPDTCCDWKCLLVQSLNFPRCFSLVLREVAGVAGTTDKVHPPYRSKDEGGVASCILLVPSSYAIRNLRQAGPGPDLLAGIEGASSSENPSRLGIEEFFNDPMLTRLIDQTLVDNRERRILARDSKSGLGDCSVRSSKGTLVQNAIARAIICSMMLVLSSCGIPDLRPVQTAPDVPADFDGPNGPTTEHSEENSSQLGIDEFFGDSILKGLIEQALVDNRELKILNEDVQIARNEILARQGAYLPFVTVGASAGLEKPSLYTTEGAAENQLLYPPGKHFPDPLPDFMGGLNLFWQLDIWRQLRNARDAAIQRYYAAIERRNFFVTRLVADVAERYYNLVALDKRIENLGRIIQLQEQSLKVAQAEMDAGRTTALPVRRFEAEIRKNQSTLLVMRQEIIQTENRINFLLNRYPQPVERFSDNFFDLNIHALSVGLPVQLLENRPDIRQAEHEIEAAGLDVQVARANFLPRVNLLAGVGYEAFNPAFLFLTPESLIYNVGANLVAPLVNKKAIQAQYMSANAKQLQAIYNYQRTILDAFTQVVNRLSKVQNYGRSIEIKRQQLNALQASVEIASTLFQRARADYVDVLFAQRDLVDARMALIDTKNEQLSAIVQTYQALGGGDPRSYSTVDLPSVP